MNALRCLVAGFCVLSGSAGAGQASGPTLLLQPGMVTTHVASSSAARPSGTGFNMRFATIVPTGTRWLRMIAGASVALQGLSSTGERERNEPVVFVGNLFPLFSAASTHGWISGEAPVLISHGPGGGTDGNRRSFGQDLVLELAFTAHVGAKLLGAFGGQLARLRAYAILNQNLTPNRTAAGTRDRLDPTAYYGITIPIGREQGVP